MSEEEKKAIETIKNLKDIKWYEHAFDRGTEILDEHEKKDIDIVLSLIKKQQKEIEELKFKNKNLDNLLQGQLYDYYKYYKELANSYQANSISKDKIKEKINYYDERGYIEIAGALKLLLEE